MPASKLIKVVVALIAAGEGAQFNTITEYGEHYGKIHKRDNELGSKGREVIKQLIDDGVLKRVSQNNLRNTGFCVADTNALLDLIVSPADSIRIMLLIFNMAISAVSAFMFLTTGWVYALLVFTVFASMSIDSAAHVIISLFEGMKVGSGLAVRTALKIIAHPFRRRSKAKNDDVVNG